VKGGKVESMRLIQVFLSQSQSPGPSIFEVSTNNDGDLFCTCSGYKGRRNCKHTKFVQARIDSNDGSYPLEISNRATEEEAQLAKTSNEKFREFIIKYGKIEVF